MNLLNDWIPESMLYAMGWMLVHSLWQLVIISGGLWVILKIFRNNTPAFKYNLGLGALGVAFLAASGTFIYEISYFTPTPLLERLTLVFTPDEISQASATLGFETMISMSVHWIEMQLPLLVNFWFIGAVLFLFRLFNSLSEVRTLRKSSSAPQDYELEKMLYRLMGKMKVSKNVEIRLTSYGVSPITFGFLKPIILIPTGLIFQLTPVQLEAIIAHELAHVKRNDYLANLSQSVLEVLFFYHPCYWWMNQTVKELRENAADDLAVKVGVVPQELAYSLAEVLNFAKQNPPELALAAAKKRNPTLQRIKRILGHPAQSYPQNPIISIPMLLTLLLSAGLMATAQQDVDVSVDQVKPVVIVQKDSLMSLTISSTDNISLDTIRSKIDSLTYMSFNNGGFIYRNTSDTLFFENMPELGLTPMPQFPSEAMAPVMDFAVAPTPDMEFEMAPMMDFDMGTMPAMDFDMGAMPAMDFAVAPPVFDFPAFSSMDTINMSTVEKEKWQKQLEQQADEYAEKMENWEASMKPKMEAYEERMAAWQKSYQPKMDDFEEKIQAWQQEMEPKLKAFEKKMAEWQKASEPKMKEFETKMEAWHQANEPKLEEFQEKMKAWEKEMQPKIEEYQRKMEVWQKENASKIEEFQKRFEESLKKKDDNQ